VGVLQGIADVILILAAFFSLIAFGFLAYTGLTIYRMVKQIRGEVGDLTSTAKESLTEVQGTSRVVSESIVKPASMAMGYATAIRATIRALSEDVVKKTRP
jgi:hypothetical protein